MVSYNSLLSSNLEPLSDAISKWRHLPGHFRQIRENFQNHVQKPLVNSDWHGHAADAAEKQFHRTSGQLGKAAEEAQDVHHILESAYNQFKKCKKQLQNCKKAVEDDPNLKIDKSGTVSYEPAETAHHASPQQGKAEAKAYEQVVSDYNNRIGDILEKATSADELLDWALRTDANGRRKGFTGAGVSSLKEAKKAREDAAKDAKDLTTRIQHAAATGRDLSVHELQEANTLMRKHEGDPYFGEKFATGLGGRGTLEFWQRNADRQQTGDARTKTLSHLQKTLGLTLATASHSDSGAMTDWKHDVIRLGTKRFDDAGATQYGPGVSKGPYGFQIMSSIMRNGEYDKDFLHEYGKGYGKGHAHVPGLIEFDKKASEHGSPKDFWTSKGDYEAMLNLGEGGDKGMDPLAGYMEALGHNPEAGKELFYKEGFEYKPNDEFDPDLKYLLHDRKWPDGNPLGASKNQYGYDELGHALEATTLGRPYDEPDLGLHKSPEGANVMSQTVRMVAADSGFLDDRGNLGGSLAKMGAGYIDNLDRGISDFGDSPYGEGSRKSAFGDIGNNDINIGRKHAANFMSIVGGDDDGYKILSTAQHEFTQHSVKNASESNDPLKLSLETGAESHGILDQARGEAIMDDAEDTKEEKAQKLEEAAEWRKFGGSQAIGQTASLVTAPLEATRSAGISVPIVDTVSESMQTQQEIMIDREVQHQQDAFDGKIDAHAEDMKSEFRSKGEGTAQDPLDAYISANRHLDGGDWHDDATQRIKNGYSRGYGYR